MLFSSLFLRSIFLNSQNIHTDEQQMYCAYNAYVNRFAELKQVHTKICVSTEFEKKIPIK